MKRHPHYKVWLDGRIVNPENAVISVFTQTALRGANVYEGVRAYWNADHNELFVWKLNSHLKRLFQNMKAMRMTPPFSWDQMVAGVIDWIRANEFREDIHFRVVAYFGDGGAAGVRAWRPDEIDCGVFIAGGPRQHKEALENGLHLCVSSWRRISDDSIPPRIKAGANYQNSRLAGVEARVNGYDDAIILNREGKVAEATGACVMIVREGLLATSPVTSGALDSITRRAILEMYAGEYGKTPEERPIDRTELYFADESFLCGTAEEITPIVTVDRIEIGDGRPGAITRRLQEMYLGAARGRDQRYANERLPVYSAQAQKDR